MQGSSCSALALVGRGTASGDTSRSCRGPDHPPLEQGRTTRACPTSGGTVTSVDSDFFVTQSWPRAFSQTTLASA
jgi:hypothetical protein